MGYYAKRFFGKAKGEPRDPDLVMTVDTRITASSTTARRYQFVLKAGDKDVIIDWGDGTINNYTATAATTVGRTYAAAGIYQIRIAGSYPGFERSGNYYNNRIVSLDNWGTNEFTDMSNMFAYAPNMIANYTDKPNTSKVTTFRSCFFGAVKFSGIVNFDTSNAVSLRSMFYNSGLLPQSFAHFNIEKLEPGTNTGLDIFMSTTTSGTLLDMNEPGTTDNYDDTLISFASQNAPNGIVAHFGNSKYSDRGKAAREALVAKGWTITDGGPAPSENDFVITVDTRLTHKVGDTYGGSSLNKFHMPFYSDKNYDCTINWGDNTASQTYKLKGGSYGVEHTYSSPGVYQIRVSGYVPTIFAVAFPGVQDNRKIISIDNWGINEWDSLRYSLYNSTNLVSIPILPPVLTMVTDLSNMFLDSSVKASFANWDISKITVADRFLFNVDINEEGTTTNYDETLISWGNQDVQPNVIVDFGNSKYSSVGKVGRDKLIAKGWTITDGGMI